MVRPPHVWLSPAPVVGLYHGHLRIFAAGDLVRGLNQVGVAAAEAAVAATEMHNQLREPEFR